MSDIVLPISGNSYYGYGFDISLSLDTSHFVYGYGYGDFDNPDPAYFNVLSIEGDLTGYGIESKSGYQYGWGYERTSFLSGDGTDVIKVTATVTDNGGVPAESGIPVLFTSSPGVSFTSSYVLTDSSGEASTYISIDSTTLRNLDALGANSDSGERARYYSYPAFGYMTIEATIPKCMVAKDWNVTVNVEGSQSYGESEYQLITLPVSGYGYY